MLLQDDGHFVCQIINEKYQYHHVDWFTGDDLYFDLEDCLLKFEQKKKKKKINEIIKARDNKALIKP